MADQHLDTSGLNCPLPILKTKKALQGMAPGSRLSVDATDPGSVADFEAFCNATGNRLIEQNDENGVFTFVIERSA